jgi:hypothetical protein
MVGMSITSGDIPDIPDRIKRLDTGAKRHHYVAEFHQRRFSSAPLEKHPRIHQLNVNTGKTSSTSTINSCVIQHHNTLYDVPNLPRGFAEATLSAVEADAAPVIDKLVQGELITKTEEGQLALYIYFQQQRTPRGREALNFALEQGGKYWMLKQIYEGRDVHRHILIEKLGREPTEPEIAESVKTWSDDIESGRLNVLPSRDHEVGAMFMSAEAGVTVILGMSWTYVRAPAGECFILSDEPLLRVDVAHPDVSVGWLSSGTFEATLPLDPVLLLFMRPHPPFGRQRSVATPVEITALNLRTYAGAREVILGSTQGALQTVRTAAKRDPATVSRFKQQPSSFHLLESREGEATPPTVTTTRGPTTATIRRYRAGK